MTDISKFLSSDDKFVSKITKMAVSAKQYYDNGKLTEVEYENILKNIETMYEIEKEASSIERKKLLEEAINVIRTVMSFIK
jgi:hypothetical protein